MNMFYCFIYLGLLAESIRKLLYLPPLMSCTCLLRFFLGNFLDFLAIVNEVFPISCSNQLLLLDGKVLYFAIMIFHIYFPEISQLFKYSTCFTDNNIVTKYYLSFQYSYLLFILISTVLTLCSSIILNDKDDSMYLFIFPDFNGNASTISH